ncbi:hypothetical protein CSX04_05499 [Burkholderia cepacia]|nr:hypothetical protein CSX04_05499 [Burkholderia cepacia]
MTAVAGRSCTVGRCRVCIERCACARRRRPTTVRRHSSKRTFVVRSSRDVSVRRKHQCPTTGICNECRKQSCRARRIGILGEQVKRARRLEPRLSTRIVDRRATLQLRADGPLQHDRHDRTRMTMCGRKSEWRKVDDGGRHRLARDVRQRFARQNLDGGRRPVHGVAFGDAADSSRSPPLPQMSVSQSTAERGAAGPSVSTAAASAASIAGLPATRGGCATSNHARAFMRASPIACPATNPAHASPWRC